MALLTQGKSPKDFICNDMMKRLDNTLSNISKVADQIANKIDAVEKSLNDMIGNFTSLEEVKNTSKDLLTAVVDVIPDFTDSGQDDFNKELTAALENCLAMSLVIPNSSNWLKSMVDQYKDRALAMLDGILPEIDICVNLSGISDMFKDFKIEVNMAFMDGVIECMNSFCAINSSGKPISEIISEIDNRISEVNLVQDKLRASVDGKMDLNKIYDNSGLDEASKEIMNVSYDTTNTVFETYEDAKEKAISSMNGESVTLSVELSTHLNELVITSESEFYSQIDPDLEYKDEWKNTYSLSSILLEKTKKIGKLDASLKIVDCDIYESSSEDLDCYLVAEVSVIIQLGTVSHTAEGKHAVGVPICQSCGNYIITGFDECNEKEMTKIIEYFNVAINLAVEETMKQFTFAEIDTQLY